MGRAHGVWRLQPAGAGESCKPRSEVDRKRNTRLRLHQWLEQAPTPPGQVGVAASGALLLLFWQFLAERFASYERQGLLALLHVWLLLALAALLHFAGRRLARSSHAGQPQLQHHAPGAQGCDIDPCSAPRPLAAHPDQAAARPAAPAATQGVQRGQADGADAACADAGDDVTAQKLRAQAEAAAQQLARQQSMAQLLLSLRAGGELGDAAVVLFHLAELSLQGPQQAEELARQGGVPVVLALLQRAEAQLQAHDGRDAAAAVLLQASWVVLQLAHGPPVCVAALLDCGGARALLRLAAGLAGGGSAARLLTAVQQPVARNASWALLKLCSSGGVAAVAAEAEAAVSNGAAALAPLLAMCCGFDAAPLAGGALSLLLQHWRAAHAGVEAASGADHRATACAAACVSALLSADCLHALCRLLPLEATQPCIDPAAAAALAQLPALLVTADPARLLRLLVAERLLGSFLAASSTGVARLLVCQMLSSQGQQALFVIEAQFEVDVALALAQALVLRDVHMRLPHLLDEARVSGGDSAADVQQADKQPGEGGGGGADAAPPRVAGGADAAPPRVAGGAVVAGEATYTDVLTARLLLQHGRLQELVGACCEEVGGDAAGEVGSAPYSGEGAVQAVPDVVRAVTDLAAFLMARDLDMAAPRQLAGDSLVCSSSSAGSGSAGSSSARSGSCEAGEGGGRCEAPEAQGVTLGQAAGAVAAGDADAAGCCGPELCSSSGAGRICFRFGGSYEHRMSPAMYQKLRTSSKLLASLLSRRRGGDAGEPISLLSIPGFSAAANCWALRCLSYWLEAGALPSGLSAACLARLWWAADFLQVDGLRQACEDGLQARCEATPAGSPAACTAAMQACLQLCGSRPMSCSRLLQLTSRRLLRDVAAAAADSPTAAAAVLAAAAGAGGRERRALQSALLAQLRDQLVALVILNTSWADVDPESLPAS